MRHTHTGKLAFSSQMRTRNEIFRETRSADGRYVIRAYARIGDQHTMASVFGVLGVVQVFDGDPSINGRPEIFLSSSKLNSHDLLDELQNAERIGRDFIAGIR